MEQEIEKCSKLPIGNILCGMVVGAVITFLTVRFAAGCERNLMFVLEGRDAAIMFLVARRTIWMAAGLAGLLAMAAGLWQSHTDSERLGHFIAFAKLAVVIFLATQIGSTLGFASGKYIPCFNEPIAVLKGWRGFQLLDLGALLLFIPLLVLIVDRLQNRLMVARTWHRRVALLAVVAVVFGGVQVSYRMVFGEDRSDCSAEAEPDDDGPEKPNSYRLSEDEPWEVYG